MTLVIQLENEQAALSLGFDFCMSVCMNCWKETRTSSHPFENSSTATLMIDSRLSTLSKVYELSARERWGKTTGALCCALESFWVWCLLLFNCWRFALLLKQNVLFFFLLGWKFMFLCNNYSLLEDVSVYLPDWMYMCVCCRIKEILTRKREFFKHMKQKLD